MAEDEIPRIPLIEGPDETLMKRLEEFAEEAGGKQHLTVATDLRWKVAFFGPQEIGELGEDFDLEDARDVSMKVAGEILEKLPRRVKRSMAREDADFLLNVLHFAVSRGLVSGIRWAKGIGAAEPPR